MSDFRRIQEAYYLGTEELDVGQALNPKTIKVPEGTTAIYIDFESFLDFGTDSDGNVIGHKIGWQHCGHTYIGGGPDGEERVLSTYWGDVEQTDDGFVMTDTMCTEQYDINQNSGQFPGAPECAAWDGSANTSPQPCEACDDPNIQNLERSISDKIGLNVSIKNNKKNKGTITFVYHDIEQLNKIIDIIKSNY